MPSDQGRGIARRPILLYTALAYGISWAIFVPLALQAQGVLDAGMPMWAHYLAPLGPLVSALIVSATVSGKPGLAELWSRMTRWRVGLWWWLAALGPALLFLVAAAVTSLVPDSDIVSLEMLGKADFLPPLGLWMLPLWFVTYGIGEETGWRGFLLPRLQSRWSALGSAALVTLIWGLWHLPAFFYVYDPAIAPGFVVGLFAGSIMFTWMYNGTGGSILLVAVLHGVFNLTTGCTQCKTGIVSAVLSTVVMVWAIALVIWFKPTNLSRKGKHVLP